MLLLSADYPSSLCHAARRLAEGEAAYVAFFKPAAGGAAPPAGACFGMEPARDPGLAELDAKLRPEWEKQAASLLRAAENLGRDRRLAEVSRRQARLLGVTPETQRVAVVWAPPGAARGGRYEDGVVMLTLSSAMAGALAHELAHAAWRRSPRKEPLERSLARRDRDGILAATLLEEGVAGFLGPGLLGQAGAWDADPVLDAFAKGLRGLDAGSALAAARGVQRGLRLKDRFRRALIVTEGGLAALGPLAARGLDVREARLYSDRTRAAAALARHWEVPAVLILPPESLEESVPLLAGPEIAPEEVAWLKEKTRLGTAVALSWSPRGRPLLVISGRPEAVASALPEIAVLPAATPPGPSPARAGR